MGVFTLFEKLLSRKNEEIERERSKYEQGVRKLDEAKIMIETMEEQLTRLTPILVEKSKQVEKTVKRLEKESKEVFEFIRSYSPYDNIESRDYPPMLVTGGLNDPRVTYWEPAKWTAKMRALKTDNNELIMKIDMGAGHGGKSGRYDSVYESVQQIAFILDQLDVEN